MQRMASNRGPFPEAQLRDLITRGTVRADTLVWSEGMSGWQRAGEIPGLMPAGGAPPSVPQPGGPPPMSAAVVMAAEAVIAAARCRSISAFWSLSGAASCS